VLYDLALVPYLNRAVDRGVVVSTFNSEASSLQGLVATLSKERRQLESQRRPPGCGPGAIPHRAFNRRLMDANSKKSGIRSPRPGGRPPS